MLQSVACALFILEGIFALSEAASCLKPNHGMANIGL
jgi:hypothetical protein